MKSLKITLSALAALAILTTAAWAAPATYMIDKPHSSITFEVGHFGISSVPGRFDAFDAHFTYDPDKPEASTAEATIEVKSVNTGVEKRDDHLRTADFFDAEKFPQMTFKSKSVKDATKDGFQLVGDLTLHGVTKEVTLDVKVGGVMEQRGQKRAGFVATTQLDRTAFGVGGDSGMPVGKQIDIKISVEGLEKKPAEGEILPAAAAAAPAAPAQEVK